MRQGGLCVITADHGNAEDMLACDRWPQHRPLAEPRAADPTAPGANLAGEGTLADVAPTVLALLGIEQPAAMTGHSLLQKVVQRLSPQDASFLHLEDAVSHMHIGAVAILEGPSPGYEALSRMVWAHLPSVPRYRQKVHFVPVALGRPVWVDDPHFNLGHHLRRTALPPPGGDEELRGLVGRVMSHS